MKTRSQLIKGYLADTLSKTDKQDAINNKIVMNEVNRILKEKKSDTKTIKKTRRKK